MSIYGKMLVSLIAFLLLLAIGVWLFRARVGEEPGPAKIEAIAPPEARRRLQAGGNVVLLDVRTPGEYAERHIPDGVLIPLNPEDDFVKRVEERIPDKKADIIVYCRSGRRSLAAAELLVAAGYANVRDLGGILDWPYETAGEAAKK